MLGRTENLQQIYLDEFENSKLGCNANSLQESESLEKRALKALSENTWLSRENIFRISHVNIRSLKNHALDLAFDSFLLKSDIIGISETWFPQKGFILPEILAFEDYNQFFANAGRGKGVALFIRDHLTVLSTEKVCLKPFQILKAKFDKFIVIVVYRSPASHCYEMLIKSLMNLLSDTLPTVIMGDFNVDPKRDEKEFKKLVTAMTAKGFVQIINKATHLKGHLLDHMYLKNIVSLNWQLHHPYWTDHDATCLEANLP